MEQRRGRVRVGRERRGGVDVGEGERLRRENKDEEEMVQGQK